MQLTISAQNMIRVLNELFIQGKKPGGQIKFTPTGAEFTNAYFRSAICHGVLSKTFFDSYSVSEPELVRFTDSMLSNLKGISDKNITIFTTSENVVFRGDVDTYSEPKSDPDDEIPVRFKYVGHSFIPILPDGTEVNLETELELDSAFLASLPIANEYLLTFSANSLIASIQELGNFTRIIELQNILTNHNNTILLDKDNFKIAFGTRTGPCNVRFSEDKLVTNYSSDTSKLAMMVAGRSM